MRCLDLCTCFEFSILLLLTFLRYFASISLSCETKRLSREQSRGY